MSDRKPLRIYTEATNSKGGVWAFKPYAMTHVVFVEESDYMAERDRADAAEAEVRRLRGALDSIAAMETPTANATVRRMSALARAALGVKGDK